MALTGKVKWFDKKKGFGFIAPDDMKPGDKELFVHHSGILMQGYKFLVEGQSVEFTVFAGQKGQQAGEVRVTAEPPVVETPVKESEAQTEAASS